MMSWQNDEAEETVRLPAVAQPSVLPLVHHYAVYVTSTGDGTVMQYSGREEHKAQIIMQHYCMTPGTTQVTLTRDGRMFQDITIVWRDVPEEHQLL
jgi:hypothetical protein